MPRLKPRPNASPSRSTANPSGASATLGDVEKVTPAAFTDVPPGSINLVLHLDGYKDYRQTIIAQAAVPLDLGIIPLAQHTGTISLSSAVAGLVYTLTGPNNYTHSGTLPDRLGSLPVGVYQLSATLEDWKLPVQTLTLHPDENLQQVVAPPYATLELQKHPGRRHGAQRPSGAGHDAAHPFQSAARHAASLPRSAALRAATARCRPACFRA